MNPDIIIPENVIYLVKGHGYGSLDKTAYDDALWNAGIANFNIIPLSSVLPPSCSIVETKLDWNSYGRGMQLKVVESAALEVRKGLEAVAALGWIDPEGDKAGMLLELKGGDYDFLRIQMYEGLMEMSRRRGLNGEPKMVIERAPVSNDKTYTCALVAALYKIEVIKNPGIEITHAPRQGIL